jgi:bifunctional DNA-binding transcriptional regulator/antitoxin component of YhaV-PrlF toxin-antitoxin module
MLNQPIIRSADELFRIVIPREIRTQLVGIEAGARFEMTVLEDKSGILMKLVNETGEQPK